MVRLFNAHLSKTINNVKATNTQFSSYRNFSGSIFNHRLPSKYLTMPYSTCCNAHTNFTELGLCPECFDHCDWEDEEELKEDIDIENQIEQEQINKHE